MNISVISIGSKITGTPDVAEDCAYIRDGRK